MKELFMCLLLNVVNHGTLTEANMYEGGHFSNMKVKKDDGTVYSISISKEKEDKKNED